MKKVSKTSVVVKRKGHTEDFDERKLYGSVYAACASAHRHELICEKTADDISKKVKKWIKGKKSLPHPTG